MTLKCRDFITGMSINVIKIHKLLNKKAHKWH